MRVATVLTSRPQAVCSRCVSVRTQPCSNSTWRALPARHQAVFRRCMAAGTGQTTEDGNDPAQQQLREAAALDKLIDAMLAASDQQEVAFMRGSAVVRYVTPPQLTQVVAQNLLQCNQRFWLRLATRSDGAANQDEKDRLVSLSRTVCFFLQGQVVVGRPCTPTACPHRSCCWWTPWSRRQRDKCPPAARC